MATMQVKAEPINRDIALFLDSLSPNEASRQFAAIAAEQIEDASQTNAQALGRRPPSTTFVDGRAGASLESVRPDGVIVTEFELILDVLIYISNLLDQFSPVKTGRYKRSHILLADNVEIDVHTPSLAPQVAVADEYIFVNTQPYARKIEHGSSQQSPRGVYEAVSLVARRRYGKIASIVFGFRTLLGSNKGERSERQPAIIVRIG
jgi:hypothetical protein